MSNLLDKLVQGTEIFWLNDKVTDDLSSINFTKEDIEEAEKRLIRFAPYIEKVFPETASSHGIIESQLVDIEKMQKFLNVDNRLLLKLDANLPISGSVKARGGIYEVLKFAEKIALEEGKLQLTDNYAKLADDDFRELFSKYSIAVGSTGNLGLSIGIMGAKLGFSATVHMSDDARQWKKDLLREKGVTVIEYPDDYQKAVEMGRKEAAKDPNCHFVDDENSVDLFMGYAVAGKRLKKQLDEKGIVVDEKHPLYVYIPCGVGGAPGGITFGLKTYIGKDVHVYFAEPTTIPCMSLGLISGNWDEACVYDVGLSGETIADGLACAKPSALVSSIMDKILDGSFTANDDKLLPLLEKLYTLEDIFIEPSAAIGFYGIPNVDISAPEGSTHIVWTTGGSMVPQSERDKYLQGNK